MNNNHRQTTSYHYAIDAAKLVEKCRSLLHSILDLMESNSSERVFQRRAFQLLTMYDALKCVDRLIHTHLLDLLDREMEFLSSINENDIHKKAKLHQFFGEHESYPTLMDTVKTLQSAEKVAREYRSATIQNKSNHRRAQSDIPIQSDYNQALSIDDPVEDEYNSNGWYCGKRSPSPPPSPPPLQSAGDISPPPPQTHRRISTGGIVFPSDFQTPYSPTKLSRSNKYSPSKSDKDSSLFRLMMTLQLCLVRIEEANSVLCNGKARASVRCAGGRPRSISFQSEERPRFSPRRTISNEGITVSLSDDSETSNALQPSSSTDMGRDNAWRKSKLLLLASITLGGSYFLTTKSSKETTNQEKYKLVAIAGKAALGVATASFIRKRWRILTMNARVADSAEAIETWIFGWICLVNNNKEPRKNDIGHKKLLAPRKSLLWYSNGSIRFQLMKRGMDLLYASIGKAIEITRGQEAATKSTSYADEESSSLWTYVVASLAASYYNVIGPSAKSASSVANYSSSVLQQAWGVVSLPAVKKASLEAVRILKGAAIADRIEICGVSCFVLSREPCPALASALRRYRRQQKREDVRLGTIHESLLSTSFTANVSSFQKQNVILHLTGGGFFAHTIAGDLPYLLDWSAACKAVVIIPEYALLPQTFPDAITEVTNIYQSLRSGTSASLLGFAPDNIVVSGESVGGNLASALCVSLITNHAEGDLSSYEIVNDLEEGDGGIPSSEYGPSRFRLDLPDALLLCCPFLNMSLDYSSPSRVDGASDPVLPTALISTISRSYCKASVEDPLASPYYASDDILRNFPQTLIFTSSEDPLLDDSVAFNGRLRSVGVKSKLRAVPDMPHAYWGLSTAGVPEARQVLKECQQWLAKVFNVGT